MRLVVVALCLFSSAALARIELTAPADFFVDTGGTDAPGCGTTPETACKTRSYFYNEELVPNYDLKGFRATIQLLRSPHSDIGIMLGHPEGLKSLLQRAEFANILMYDTQQITFQGDCSNPRSIVTKPIGGPSFLAEQGAFFTIKCLKMVGTLNASGIPIVVGASYFSGVGIENVVFGKAPGQIDIQPGKLSIVNVWCGYEIDHSGDPGGANLAHIYQDFRSILTYQFTNACPQVIVHNRNNPAYGPAAFLVNDGAVTNLCEGGPPAAFRGMITVTAASALVHQAGPGYIYNCPDVNTLIFTPEQ